MAVQQKHEIPSGEGLTLEKLWAYHFASIERSEREWAEMRARQEKSDRELAELRAQREKSEKEQAEQQAQWSREQAERQARRDRELAELRAQREKSEKELAEQQAQRDKEQAERQAQRDRELAELRAQREKSEKELAEQQAQRDRELAELRAQREKSEKELAEQQAQRDKEQAERQAQSERERAERQAQRDKEQAQSAKEWAELREMFKETGKRIDKNNEEMGDLRNSFGEIAEHLVAPGIKDRLEELGFSFGKVSPNVEIIEDGKVIAEADFVLEDLERIAVVEVKARVKAKDVKTHLRRLEKMRGWHDRNNDRRKLVGVMAGAVFGTMERKAAIDAGFYVVVQSGDTMKMEVPEGFKPREW